VEHWQRQAALKKREVDRAIRSADEAASANAAHRTKPRELTGVLGCE
jgi:hypothetical protein